MKHTQGFFLLTVVALLGISEWKSGAGEPGVRSVRGYNLLIDISSALTNAVVQKPVDRTDPAQEIIQETPVSGMNRTLGSVHMELVPDPSHASLDLVLNGQVSAQTVGMRPHVLLYTTSMTSMEVRRRILMDGTGLRAFAGAACADTRICLLDVQSRREPDYLAMRVAAMGFEQKKNAAEAETAAKTAHRASRRLGEELTPALFSASQSVGEALSNIKKMGLTLEALDFRTSATFLQTRLRMATPGRIPANTSPTMPEDWDLGVRVHQSLFNEVAQADLAGKTFPVTDITKFYAEATRGLLRDGRQDSEQKDGLRILEKLLADLSRKPAMVKLTAKDPLTVNFSDQEVTVDIRVASIREAGMDYAGMRARAEYRIVNSRDGVQAIRKGPIQYQPLEEAYQPKKMLAAQPITFLLLRDIIFAEILKERIVLNELPLPESMAMVRFQPPRGYTRDGWLALTWKLAPRTQAAR